MATYTGADKRLQYLFEHGGGGGGSANIWTGTMAEYIAQASQIADDTAVFITDDEIQSLIVSSYDIYSEDEKEIGVFLDGKPLYQKTINTGALPNNTTKNVNHNISDIDTVVTAFGFAKASGINWIPIPFVNNTAYTDQVALFVNPSTITLRTSGDRSAYSQSYVTIKYTKTTDTAGSGLFVPSGAAAHHYSETEHIIGTWLNGETLYEKTIDFGALPANTTKNVNHNISNFDIIVDIRATATRPATQGTHTTIPIPNTHWEIIGNQNETSINDTTIMIRNHNPNASAFTKVYVTVRYTKTT